MSFTQYQPTGRTGPRPIPTIGVDKNWFITISAAAHTLLGNPTAVTIAWDEDTYQILLTPAAPGSPGAHKTGGKNPTKRFSATGFLDWAGLGTPEKGMRFPATKHGNTGTAGIIADFSTLPAPQRAAA